MALSYKQTQELPLVLLIQPCLFLVFSLHFRSSCPVSTLVGQGHTLTRLAAQGACWVTIRLDQPSVKGTEHCIIWFENYIILKENYRIRMSLIIE